MNSKSAVMVAIGLILGLLAGLAIGSTMGGETAAPRAPVLDLACGDHPPFREDEPLDKRAVPDDRNDAPVRQAPPASLKSLMEALDIPAIPTGDGEITGVVLTEDGKPLPGVTVSAGSNYPGDMGYNLKTAEERIEARMRYERWREKNQVTAITDEEGRYRIGGLNGTIEYVLTATLTGWRIMATDRRRYKAKSGETYDFVARVSMSLEVKVRMPDGSLATGGRVRASQRTGSGSTGTTDQIKAGRASLELREGPWTVYAESGTDDELKSETVTLEVVEGQPVEPIELTLKSRPGIKGSVVRSDNFTALPARVYLQSNPPAEPPAERFEREGGNHRHGSQGDNFKFIDLEPGTYRLVLVSNNRVVDWQDVAVSDSFVEADLTLPPPDRGEYIIVRAYDPGGELLTNVSFRLTTRSGNGSSSSSGGEMRHPDGSYWLSRHRHEGSSDEGAYFIVQAEHAGYGIKSVRYEVTDTHEVDIRFVNPARVTLTVSNFNDHPLRDKLAWSLVSEGDEEQNRYTRSFRGPDETTSQVSPFKLGPVEPGAYNLKLRIGNGHFSSREIYSERVTLAEGENNLSALVPPLYKLTVNAPEGNSSRLEVTGKDTDFRYRGYHSRGSDDKKLVVEGVPPGTYLVRNNEGGMTVIVNGDTEITFEPKPFDCLVLTVEPGSAMETAGFMSGDKVIGVDGEEFENMSVGYIKLQSSLAKENTSWIILRNGMRNEVAFNGPELMKALQGGKGGMDLRAGHQSD